MFTQLSTQATILAICNFVILIAVVLSMFVIKKNNDEGNKLYATIKNVFALLMFIIIMTMQVYSLNCMIYGDCHLWGWILTTFAVIGTLSYLGFFAYIAFTIKKTGDALHISQSPSSAPLSTPPIDK